MDMHSLSEKILLKILEVLTLIYGIFIYILRQCYAKYGHYYTYIHHNFLNKYQSAASK